MQNGLDCDEQTACLTRLEDLEELDENQRQIVIDAMESPLLNILDVGDSAPLSLGGAHNSWYNHPWVSMDVLLLFLLNLDPLERGLDEYWLDEIGRIYRFPDDYVTRIQKYIEFRIWSL